MLHACICFFFPTAVWCRSTGSVTSVVWSWIQPAASFCLRSVSRSEWGVFTCSTVYTDVRPPHLRKRSGTLHMHVNNLRVKRWKCLVPVADPSGVEGLEGREELWERFSGSETCWCCLHPESADVPQSFSLHRHANHGRNTHRWQLKDTDTHMVFHIYQNILYLSARLREKEIRSEASVCRRFHRAGVSSAAAHQHRAVRGEKNGAKTFKTQIFQHVKSLFFKSFLSGAVKHPWSLREPENFCLSDFRRRCFIFESDAEKLHPQTAKLCGGFLRMATKGGEVVLHIIKCLALNLSINFLEYNWR